MASKTNATDFHLRAKAILAVRHGRELAELMAGTSQLPAGDLPPSALSACMRRLRVGEVTDGRDLTALEVLHDGIAAALQNEVTETKFEWCSLGREAGENIWSAVAVPVYTDWGSALHEIQRRIERFIDARQQFIDHASAERLERRHLR